MHIDHFDFQPPPKINTFQEKQGKKQSKYTHTCTHKELWSCKVESQRLVQGDNFAYSQYLEVSHRTNLILFQCPNQQFLIILPQIFSFSVLYFTNFSLAEWQEPISMPSLADCMPSAISKTTYSKMLNTQQCHVTPRKRQWLKAICALLRKQHPEISICFLKSKQTLGAFCLADARNNSSFLRGNLLDDPRGTEVPLCSRLGSIDNLFH